MFSLSDSNCLTIKVIFLNCQNILYIIVNSTSCQTIQGPTIYYQNIHTIPRHLLLTSCILAIILFYFSITHTHTHTHNYILQITIANTNLKTTAVKTLAICNNIFLTLTITNNKINIILGIDNI